MNGYSINSKHMVIMLLCCLIPLVGFFLISAFGIPVSSLGTFALILLCPLLHIVLMRGMHGKGADGQQSCHESKPEPARALPSKEG